MKFHCYEFNNTSKCMKWSYTYTIILLLTHSFACLISFLHTRIRTRTIRILVQSFISMLFLLRYPFSHLFGLKWYHHKITTHKRFHDEKEIRFAWLTDWLAERLCVRAWVDRGHFSFYLLQLHTDNLGFGCDKPTLNNKMHYGCSIQLACVCICASVCLW